MTTRDASLRLRPRPGVEIARLVDAPPTILDGRAWLARNATEGAGALPASPDGNRGAIVRGHQVDFDGRSWLLAVKGVGARAPLYGASPLDFTHVHALDCASLGHPTEASLLYAILRESWMGEAPYGAQGLDNATHALSLSAPGMREALEPALLCPVIAVVRLCDEDVVDAFHYRRYDGPVVQEHRLVPSTIRLYHQSDIALGRDVDAALATLGVDTPGALDVFLDTYLRTGLALLTLGARSVRIRGHSLEMLDYDDAWLDKDAFVAPDGALVFADLEALVWTPLCEATARARHRRQIERNAYEFLYGADLLLRTEERWRGRSRDARARREALALRTRAAIAGDPVVHLEAGADAWFLEVQPRVGEPFALPWLGRD